MVAEGLVDGSEHFLGDFLAPLQVMVTIWQHLRLDDWHQAVLLADRSVSGENVRVFQDGKVCRLMLANLECAAPFGKVSAVTLVLLASLVQTVETLGCSLTISTGKRDCALIDLY